MNIAFILASVFLYNSVQCFDSESLEYNGIQVSPSYETIIFSDIADIINDFDKNNVPFETNNESESEEDIEDLLSEYQHYVEKAHKQRINYLEKQMLKNKVPTIRHEKFNKMKPALGEKHDDYNSFYNPEHKSPLAFNNPVDMFIPFNANKYLGTSKPATHLPKNLNDLSSFNKIILSEEKPATLPVKSSCYCKNGTGPCNCGCKQCFLPHKINPNTFRPSDEDNTFMMRNPMSPELSDDTLNIRIKVDVQLPKTQEHTEQFSSNQNRNKKMDYDAGNFRGFPPALRIPSPYFDLPIPMNIFGFKKTTKFGKHDTSPLHKVTIHKKKKSKLGNGNKKHRKKVITFHNIKIDPHQLYKSNFGAYNVSENIMNENETNKAVDSLQSNATQTTDANFTTAKPVETVNMNMSEKQTEENIFLLVNISNHIENGTNDIYKTENSFETEYTNVIINVTTQKPSHLLEKRNIAPQNKSDTIEKKPVINNKTSLHAKSVSKVAKLSKEKTNIKNLDKSLLSEAELLYWPSNNGSQSTDISKNITTIILENENKKGKLNMSTDILRRNHTRALEQAIFGNVDWNDVDAVAPAFISFMGKYIEGILTFCSESVCHSMKCSNKVCLHRVCVPKDRFNNKGHCTGFNNTESVASMESIMDLPSNVASEVIEILQDRMIGKLFGKVTICINFKCNTFAVSKKVFYKSKCTVKELSPIGHCTKSEEVKVA